MQFSLPLLTLLLAAASALAEPLSQNAAARAALAARQAGVFAPQHGLARRSHDLVGGRKMHARRRPSTAAQREAQAKLNAYADQQAAINVKWQAAAMESLKAGQTPQTFDEFASGQAAGSAPAAAPAPAADSSNDDASKDSSDDKPAAVSSSSSSSSADEDCDADADEQKTEDSKPAAAAAPVVKTKEKASPAPAAQPKQDAPKQQEAPKQEAPKQDTPKQTSNNNGGGGSGDKTGDMTYYATGLGACGWTNNDSDYIVAASAQLYDSFGFSNDSKICGRKVQIFYGGKSITATVSDRCPGCALNDLDLSPSAFSALANQDIGRTKMTWKWA